MKATIWLFFWNKFLSRYNVKIINACKSERVSLLVVYKSHDLVISRPTHFFFHSGQPTNTMTVRIKYNKAVTLKHHPKLLRLLSAVCVLILMSQKLGR